MSIEKFYLKFNTKLFGFMRFSVVRLRINQKNKNIFNFY